MKLTKRQWTLGAVLAATLGAVAWVSGGDPAGETVSGAAAGGTSTSARRATSSSEPASEAVQPQRLVRMVAQRKVGDPFGSVNFAPPVALPKPAITVAAAPPAPPVVVAPPAAPTAPPFPWTFMGRLIEDPQNPSVFLSRGERLTVAHLGETLENSWKVVGMDARGLRVEYMPLKSTQTVNMPNGSDVIGSVSGATVGAQSIQQMVLPQIQQQIAPQEAPQQQGQDAHPAAPAPAAAAAPVSGIDLSSGFGTPSPR
jgi:hypothetical protein